jgi:virginiamycin B lyase
MNQLGHRVEAGRDTSTATVAHSPSSSLGIHAPYAIAAGAAGIWFTEYSAPTLVLMAPVGAFKRVDLDLDGFPERLTVGRDGAVWFTDPQGGRIGRIFPGNSKADYYFVPTPRSGPAGIAATRDGSIWFTEHAADKIAILVPPGADRPTLGSHGFAEFPLPLGGGPAGIVAAADGSLWFAENSGNRIGRIILDTNSDQPVITEYFLPVPHSHPNSVAVGGDGNVYFTELAASRIGKITPQGQISEVVLPVKGPALDIIAGGDGSIWITVPAAHAICRLRSGAPIAAFYLPETAIPAFIADGADGNLYVTEPTGKIARFTPAGVLTEFRLTD